MGLSEARSWSTQAADCTECQCAEPQLGMGWGWRKTCPGGGAVLPERGTEGCLEEEAFELGLK